MFFEKPCSVNQISNKVTLCLSQSQFYFVLKEKTPGVYPEVLNNQYFKLITIQIESFTHLTYFPACNLTPSA